MSAVENGVDSDTAMAEGDPSIDLDLRSLRSAGRMNLEKEKKKLLHQKFLAHTRRTKSSKAEGRRREQLFLADPRSPQLHITLFSGDMTRAAASRFQESSAFQTIVDRADERTKFVTSVLGDIHTTGTISPTLGWLCA